MKKLIFVFTCLLFAIPCRARIITVDDDGPADFGYIQFAINLAKDGDIVIVQSGLYRENINFNGKNITLRSTEPANPSIVASTVIDGSLGGSVVTFAGTEHSGCVLSGFTITNGRGTKYCGGGIYGNGTLATIQYNVISGNCVDPQYFPSSAFGGGLYDCDGIIQFNIISGNEVICDEGGAHGGGIYGCDGTIQKNIIRGNLSTGFSGGWGYIEGGGLSNCNGTIQNNMILSNYAGGWGGAARGGGLSNCNGTIQNNTIFGNWTEETDIGLIDYGGGLSDCKGIIRNCIIWQNNADQGAQIYASSTPSYSCIQDWSGDGTDNIVADPCFVSSNSGDYHLKSQAGRWEPTSQNWVKDDVTSPCIDAGDQNSDWIAELWPHGKQINMGAYGGTSQASMSPRIDLGYIADLNNDDKVNFGDLKLFTNEWQNEQLLLSEDLDRNGFVDFNDFAIFGLQWSYPSASEPKMTYNIDDCNMEAGLRWTAATESNEPRFKVWVEGRYIYFQDQMYANCCPDELGLDKEINGNQIILYEIGYGGLCDCMCYFPITATIGPFENGTYTVEVYDNYGKSLGVVEVTIGGPTGPGITFQIDECSLFLAAGRESETRFTVTVEGLYIHFEDTMVANCCPDELGLEMTIEENLITIYETEYTSEGCRCVCFYPVTATLGPFEPGTYTLEVYEYHDGFIGSTSVVIDPPQ